VTPAKASVSRMLDFEMPIREGLQHLRNVPRFNRMGLIRTIPLAQPVKGQRIALCQ
jgi:hypothetical protein